MKITRNIIIVVVSLIIVLVACRHREGGFTVNTPLGWSRTDTTWKGEKNTVMRPVVAGMQLDFLESINIGFFKYGGSVEKYIDLLTNRVEKIADHFKIKDKGDFKLNGYHFYWIQNELAAKNNPNNIEQKTFFIKEGGNLYMIVCTTLMGKLDLIQVEVGEVINSFRIL